MKLLVQKNFEELSKKAAAMIAEEIRRKPDIVLGLATGGTPLGTYKELIRMHKEEGLDFSKVVTFNLDEYYNLSPENDQSYYYYMHENFFNHINMKPQNIHIPDGKARDIEAACREYDKMISEYGGIDLQLLGIGQNGHIGFNEPGDELLVDTHLTELKKNTILVNSRYFASADDVPKKAVTMGLGTIMQAEKILLIANGNKKAKIMNELLGDNTVSTKVPASFLLLHKDLTIIIDEEAAQLYNKKQNSRII